MHTHGGIDVACDHAVVLYTRVINGHLYHVCQCAATGKMFFVLVGLHTTKEE
jgi:hypothetical protein